MMTRIFISPCGTSILTNKTDSTTRKFLLETANLQEKELSAEQKEKIDRHVSERQRELNDFDLSNVKKISAELNGILTYYHTHSLSSPAKQDLHYLLGTDTYQGRKVAELISNWLISQGYSANSYIVPQLTTRHVDSFQEAMSNLIRWCDETFGNSRNNSYHHVIFNLTGGFKSVIGFLQAIGMFYADESIYIFESSNELLTIPRLPLILDKKTVVGNNLMTFRLLDRLKHIPLSSAKNIPETLLSQVDDQVMFSVWGELVWTQLKNDFYGEKLLDPIAPQLFYSEGFKKEINQLPFDRIAIINHRLDQFSKYLMEGGQYNPYSLDVKPLVKNPAPPSTHEIDAWSDGNAKRIFFHREAEKVIIDRLADGLTH